jgi:hypothetical protein
MNEALYDPIPLHLSKLLNHLSTQRNSARNWKGADVTAEQMEQDHEPIASRMCNTPSTPSRRTRLLVFCLPSVRTLFRAFLPCGEVTPTLAGRCALAPPISQAYCRFRSCTPQDAPRWHGVSLMMASCGMKTVRPEAEPIGWSAATRRNITATRGAPKRRRATATTVMGRVADFSAVRSPDRVQLRMTKTCCRFGTPNRPRSARLKR